MNNVFLRFKSLNNSMKHKLFLQMLVLIIFLLVILFAILSLLGQFKTPKAAMFETTELQLGIFTKEVSNNRNQLAMMGIHFSEEASAIIEEYLNKNRISFDLLADSEKNIHSIQETLFDTVNGYLKEVDCSGAFVVLNTTVNTSVSSSTDSKSGIYLQVNGYEIDHQEVLLYRGITDIAKKHNVMPHRKWRLECNKNLFPKFDHVMDMAKYPLENSYYFTDMFTLPGMSEQAALLMLPVTGSDGTVYGICGFEMSESFFKQYYRQDTKLSHMTGLMTSGTAKDSISDYFVCGSSDNYYYSPQGELEIKDFGKGLSLFNSESESFTGVIRSSDSDSAGNTFTTVVMVPKTDYDKSAWGSTLHMLLILLLLTCFAVIGCLYSSHQFLAPVLKSLEQIRTDKKSMQHTKFQEINNLLDFLEEKDNETERTILELEAEMSHSRDELYMLHNEYNDVQKQYEAAKAEISRLAYSRKNEVDPDAYQHFLDCLKTLTPKENEIFSLYLDGKSSKEIQSISNINENTLKYHNRNIYSKLGVNSRRQLLMYAALMQKDKADQ